MENIITIVGIIALGVIGTMLVVKGQYGWAVLVAFFIAMLV